MVEKCPHGRVNRVDPCEMDPLQPPRPNAEPNSTGPGEIGGEIGRMSPAVPKTRFGNVLLPPATDAEASTVLSTLTVKSCTCTFWFANHFPSGVANTSWPGRPTILVTVMPCPKN